MERFKDLLQREPSPAAARLGSRLAASGASSELRSVAVWAPGRVELLGKHTDYCGGRSLLCAVDRGFTFLAVAREDGRVRMEDGATGERFETDFAATVEVRGHWGNYPATVVSRMAQNFGAGLKGADIVFESDLPAASGLSSSSAFIVGTFLTLAEVNGLEGHPAYRENIRSREELAHYLGCVENGSAFGALAGLAGVGTSGGSQDHTAILCSEAGAVVQYAFCPVRRERVIRWPEEMALLICDSGVRAEKTGAAMEKYNAISRRARDLVELWNTASGGKAVCLREAIQQSEEAEIELREIIRERVEEPERTNLHKRLEQFEVEAMQLIPRAAEDLEQKAWGAFSEEVTASQRYAETHLNNQVAETMELHRRLIRMPGVVAASAFGAGFGGSLWAMCRREDLGHVKEEVGRDYRAWEVRPSGPAGVL